MLLLSPSPSQIIGTAPVIKTGRPTPMIGDRPFRFSLGLLLTLVKKKQVSYLASGSLPISWRIVTILLIWFVPSKMEKIFASRISFSTGYSCM